MTWTAFWYGIAAIFEFCFRILKKLANAPNALAWITIICLLLFWILQLAKHKKEAERDGTYI